VRPKRKILEDVALKSVEEKIQFFKRRYKKEFSKFYTEHGEDVDCYLYYLEVSRTKGNPKKLEKELLKMEGVESVEELEAKTKEKEKELNIQINIFMVQLLAEVDD
jgi:hypothetical protein